MYIDNVKFAREGRQLTGEIKLSQLARVQEVDENYHGILKYQLQGQLDKLNRPTLQLSIYGIISALCQNCLQPMELTIDNRSQVTIFKTEDQLDEALFADSEADVEDGVLAETEFDVMQLVEDEIIMSLPYASKHESCVGLSYHDDSANPFSILNQIV